MRLPHRGRAEASPSRFSYHSSVGMAPAARFQPAHGQGQALTGRPSGLRRSSAWSPAGQARRGAHRAGESVFELIGHATRVTRDWSEEGVVTGTIRTLRVDKGFGFIKDDKGQEYFFHQSAIYGEGINDLREGDSVEFEIGQGPKGPRAENVRRTST
jgi:CspA family cold shock protein